MSPKVNFNINYDGNELERRIVKWIPRHITQRLSPEAINRRKILAMARECASRLKLCGWDLVAWDPENLTSGMLEILAASEECSTSDGSLRLARNLANYPTRRSQFERIIAEIFNLDLKLRHYAPYRDPCSVPILIEQDLKFFHSICKNHVTETLADPVEFHFSFDCPTTLLRNFPINLVSDFHREFQSALELVNRYKFQQLTNDLSVRSILECLTNMLAISNVAEKNKVRLVYTVFLQTNCSNQGDLQQKTDNNELSDLDDIHMKPDDAGKWTQIQLRVNQGNVEENTDNNDPLGLKDMHRKLYDANMWLHHQFLVELAFREYQNYVHERLQAKTNVGKMTNFRRLRGKHFFNSHAPDEFVVQQYFRALPNMSTISSRNIEESREYEQSDQQSNEIDILAIMNRVLGGQLESASNIQVSIVDQITAASQIGKNTFLGKLQRRQVKLIQCGKDRAFIIPYLNKIVLELLDKNWVRDYDAKALQPYEGIYRGGAVRRAANVLLALEYRDEGEPFVNETGLHIIHAHARKSELYSKSLWDHLLSVMSIKSRIDVRGLITTARQVFQEDSIMVSALVRETIHDRVLMKSHFSPGRIIHEGELYENDAYYTLCYCRGGYGARNNILWGSGVPIHGLFLDNNHQTGEINGIKMYSAKMKSTSEQSTVWLSESAASCSDVDKPSAFLESEMLTFSSQGKFYITQLENASGNPYNFKYFPDIKLGPYCTVRHGKRRKGLYLLEDKRLRAIRDILTNG